MDWIKASIQPAGEAFAEQARVRQATLTKPPGSLGFLEDIAVRLASLQQTGQPTIESVQVTVFAADHGIAEAGVSAFPQEVTGQMVTNFVTGGATANVLARHLGACFEVVDTGLRSPLELTGLIVDRAGPGTANFAVQPAMTQAQLEVALNAGKSAVDRAVLRQVHLFIGGEMGIGNTTSASALAAAVLKISPHELTGAGTGLDAAGIQRKAALIEAALALHLPALNSPFDMLKCLGGFEIAALTGAYISAAQQRMPVLVDGFISTVAALIAVEMAPDCAEWFFYGHVSQERGHQRVLTFLKARPLLNLDMRLGEGSGALVAVPVLQMACKLHNEMATFEQAGISAA